MKKWVKDNRVTEEFKRELDKQGVIDAGGYRYAAGEMFGRTVVMRRSLETGKVEYVDHESSWVFED